MVGLLGRAGGQPRCKMLDMEKVQVQGGTSWPDCGTRMLGSGL